MSAPVQVRTPLEEAQLKGLKAGDLCEITGVLFTARDAAHKRFLEAIRKGEPLPVDLRGQILYYVGPTPAKAGQVIGSAGPTTAVRMDSYLETMLARTGLKATIGKGHRTRGAVEAMKRHGAVYFAALGGAGALLSKHIKKAEVVAYEDLGTEACRRLEVERFPVYCINDLAGNDFYRQSKAKWQTWKKPKAVEAAGEGLD
ncbi:MAG TPA: FumA C-terminus/TtdB family hydratase beta subunit [Candidatus Thermoplasmatota archaeon]|nr:FumA C-terminus/TtdB family hydratase beta subunit [Candidatus Thermoplasmatota archaeon]